MHPDQSFGSVITDGHLDTECRYTVHGVAGVERKGVPLGFFNTSFRFLLHEEMIVLRAREVSESSPLRELICNSSDGMAWASDEVGQGSVQWPSPHPEANPHLAGTHGTVRLETSISQAVRTVLGHAFVVLLRSICCSLGEPMDLVCVSSWSSVFRARARRFWGPSEDEFW